MKEPSPFPIRVFDYPSIMQGLKIAALSTLKIYVLNCDVSKSY